MKKGIVAFALVVGLIATAAACGSSQASKCTPGVAVACVGPGGCAGGQICNSDGASFGSCDCAGSRGVDWSDSGREGSSGSSSDGSIPSICAPCWPNWACLAGYTATTSTLVYFGGTQSPDGSCTLTQTEEDGGVLTAVILECNGTTNQGSTWTYGSVPAAPQLGTSVQFTEQGSVYGADDSIVTDQLMYCGSS